MFLFALVGLVTFHGVFSRQCYFFPDGPDGEGKYTIVQLDLVETFVKIIIN